jgi:HSP20 family protein
LRTCCGAFDRLPSLRGATTVPKVSVAESKDAFDVTVELPGVEENDIRLNVEDNQLVISGEKKEASHHDERDWHVEERSYGSFYRTIPLPFRPEEQGVEAFLDKGVLNIRVAKPAEARDRGPRNVEIKSRQAPASKGEQGEPAPQQRQDDHTKAAE